MESPTVVPHGVLIVGETDDAREVLRTVLERHGVCTWTAREPHAGLALAREVHPSVTVLDTESLPADDPALSHDYDAAARADQSALLVLGTARRPEPCFREQAYMSKPYQFAPLISKIEALAQEVAQRRAA